MSMRSIPHGGDYLLEYVKSLISDNTGHRIKWFVDSRREAIRLQEIIRRWVPKFREQVEVLYVFDGIRSAVFGYYDTIIVQNWHLIDRRTFTNLILPQCGVAGVNVTFTGEQLPDVPSQF